MATRLQRRRAPARSAFVTASLFAALVACGDGAPEPDTPSAPQPAAAPEPESNLRSMLKLEDKPDIVLISIDTLRADHLGCYGYERDTSPALDAFAAGAVLFEHAISQAPVTAPSHMSLFTGLTPSVHRVYNLGNKEPTVLADGIPTLVELLAEHGYHAMGIHGGGNVSSDLGFDRGFASYSSKFPWYHVRTQKDPWRPVREHIEQSREEGKPLFLFLHNYAVHDPYIHAPEEDLHRYLTEPVEGLPMRKTELGDLNDFAGMRRTFWENVDGEDPRHVNHIVSLYDGGVRYADYLFAQIQALLRNQGIYDDAIVIVVSDHGEELFDHGDKLHWRLLVETLHVPLIIKFPGGRYANTRIQRPVRLFDVMPTLLEVVGIPEPSHMQATPLTPLVAKTPGYDPFILSYADYKPETLRLQHDGFVYTNQPSAGTAEWLFDFAADPTEQNNLVAERLDRLEAMRATTAMLQKADLGMVGDLGSTEGAIAVPDAALLEQLEALGYVQGGAKDKPDKNQGK